MGSCDGFLELPCFDDLYSSEEYQSGAGWNIPQLGLPDVFLLIKLRLWVWGRKTTEAKCLSVHHIKGTYCQHDLHWCWPPPPGWGASARLFHCTSGTIKNSVKSTGFLFVHTLSLEGSHLHRGELGLPFQGVGSAFALWNSGWESYFSLREEGACSMPPGTVLEEGIWEWLQHRASGEEQTPGTCFRLTESVSWEGLVWNSSCWASCPVVLGRCEGWEALLCVAILSFSSWTPRCVQGQLPPPLLAGCPSSLPVGFVLWLPHTWPLSWPPPVLTPSWYLVWKADFV